MGLGNRPANAAHANLGGMEIPAVKRLIEAINAHDIDAIASNFAEDVDTSHPAHPARAFVGRENVRKNWVMILKAFPDIRVEVVDSVTVGDDFWGEFHYIRPGAADMRGVIVITVRGDEIVRSRFFMEEVEEAPTEHPMPSVPPSAGQEPVGS
ncbi:Ketosteroid isomerase-related protein [Kibdelosporangium aridum]|uniref:Ketosteroid isomerase-related protein n=2 Tax=Kibdelosporangium aridum TaxID=2030 RepID=A0A1W2G0F3_KIBAR|nr:Ketosteroid isomerase-related protein [Kibdelosporangium aridum]